MVKRSFASFCSNHHPVVSLAHPTVATLRTFGWNDSSCSSFRMILHHQQSQRNFRTTAYTFHQADLQVRTTHRTKRGRSKRKHSWSIPELEQETQRLIQLVLNKQHDPKNERDTTSIHHCYDILEAWMEVAKNDGYGITAAKQAHQLLQALEDNLLVLDRKQQQHGGGVLVPKTSFYDVVLQSYALSGGGLEAAKAAQDLLEHMIERAAQHTNFPRPATKTFNVVLNAWAKSGVLNAGLEADALLKRMQEWSGSQQQLQHGLAFTKSNHHRPVDENDVLCRINERTIGSVMDAWAKSNHPDAPERVERLLQWALEQKESPNGTKCIDLVVFHTVMNTWVRSKRGREAARQVEATFEYLQQRCPELKANTRTYSLIVDGWAQCEAVEQLGYASKRATFILKKMIKMYREGVDVKPNTWSFTSCIAAWSRCRHVPEAASEAENLLDTLIELYKETGDRDFIPDVDAGNAVIAAWVRASDDPQAINRGRNILNKMKAFARPNLVSYNTLLGGMAKRGFGKDALQLLEWLGHSSDLKPNIYSFNITLDALAKDEREGTTEAAEELLGRMERSNVRPDRISYSSVINAWARSAGPDKAFRAAALVDAMLQRSESGDGGSVKPDAYVFTTLLTVCFQSSPTLTKEQSQAVLAIAVEAMKRLESGVYGMPNHASYNAYMTAINNLCTNDMDRKSLMQTTFAACAEAGYVSEGIMKYSPDRTEYPREVLLQWSRNVPIHERPLVAR